MFMLITIMMFMFTQTENRDMTTTRILCKPVSVLLQITVTVAYVISAETRRSAMQTIMSTADPSHRYSATVYWLLLLVRSVAFIVPRQNTRRIITNENRTTLLVLSRLRFMNLIENVVKG